MCVFRKFLSFKNVIFLENSPSTTPSPTPVPFKGSSSVAAPRNCHECFCIITDIWEFPYKLYTTWKASKLWRRRSFSLQQHWVGGWVGWMPFLKLSPVSAHVSQWQKWLSLVVAVAQPLNEMNIKCVRFFVLLGTNSHVHTPTQMP